MKQNDCQAYVTDSAHTKAAEKASEAMRKYAQAVELYASSDLSLRSIAEQCGVSPRGLSAHIGRHFRHLLFARHGLDPGNPEGLAMRVKPRRGQSQKTHLKYKAAIEACGDMAYIGLNVSQVARLFGLSGPALASQLRVHYPEVMPDRERIRQRLGLADRAPRGSRAASAEAYSAAADMYRDTDLTISQVACECGVSPSGLGQFMRFYRRDAIVAKARRRSESRRLPGRRLPGALSGSGTLYGPGAATVARYARALEMYRDTPMTVREIADAAGVPYEAFRDHLSQWHRGEKLRRRGCEWDGASEPDLAGARPFRKSSRAKYAEAISSLRESPRDVARAAADFGLEPDSFRAYLKAHEPELAASRGMERGPGGKAVRRASREKYRAAIEEYSSSPEPLSSIARRHGVEYKSLSSFVARNCAAEREGHARALAQAAALEQAAARQRRTKRNATQQQI